MADAEAEERAAERAEEELLVREADEKLRRRKDLQGTMLHVNPPLVDRGGPDSPKSWWVGRQEVWESVGNCGRRCFCTQGAMLHVKPHLVDGGAPTALRPGV